MNQLSSNELIKLNEILVGGTEPIGETNYDQQAEYNLKRLIDLGDWVLDGVLYASEYHDRYEYSMRQVGQRAKATMLEWRDWLSEKLSEMDGGEDGTDR